MENRFNSFIRFLIKDRPLIFSAVFISLLIFLLLFLRNINKKQAIELAQLEEKRQLVLKIPEFEKKLSTLYLNGIILSEEKAVAIINNTILRTGDKIGENKVVQIKRNSVVLNDGSKDFELNLAE